MYLRLLENVNSKTKDLKNQPVLTNVLLHFEKKLQKSTV